MKYILVTFLMVASIAQARVKDIGGGSGSGSASGGTSILDQAAAPTGARLDGTMLLTLVTTRYQSRLQAFPYLGLLLQKMLVEDGAKAWVFDDRPFPAGCENHVGVQINIQDWACQDQSYVRVHSKSWAGMTDASRGDLVLHEILTGMRLADDSIPSTFSVVSPMVADFLNPQMTVAQLQSEWHRLGFGALLTGAQIAQAAQLFKAYEQQLCVQADDPAAQRLAFNEPVLLQQATSDDDVIALVAKASMTAYQRFAPGLPFELVDAQNRHLLYETWQAMSVSN